MSIRIIPEMALTTFIKIVNDKPKVLIMKFEKVEILQEQWIRLKVETIIVKIQKPHSLDG